MTLRTGAIVQALGGELQGDPDRLITQLAPLERAQPSELSFLVNPRLAPLLKTTQAGCVIVGAESAEAARQRGGDGAGDCIVADNPHLYFARVTQMWKRLHGGAARRGVHPSAVVEEGAFVHPTASVGALMASYSANTSSRRNSCALVILCAGSPRMFHCPLALGAAQCCASQSALSCERRGLVFMRRWATPAALSYDLSAMAPCCSCFISSIHCA